jgi:hypothetical protein
MHLVQLSHAMYGRRVAVVEGNELRLLTNSTSVYAAVISALFIHAPLAGQIQSELGDETLSYEEIYADESDWHILPPLDHPDDPARCLVSGTGLTHRKGAANRNAMHQTTTDAAPVITDSMKMYQWGEAGGRPNAGEIGVQPEWFYKGNGTILRGHNEELSVPSFAEDGGEEPEVVGLYVIDQGGVPRRLGFAIGNEFSDHVMEKRNYLYLAPSKLRTCAVGPELALGASFESFEGSVQVKRKGEIVWENPISTGEAHMVHSLANLEHHHFKYPLHRRPGDVHLHFFGTGAFSFGAGVTLENGDEMIVDIPALGRPLRNTVAAHDEPQELVRVKEM